LSAADRDAQQGVDASAMSSMMTTKDVLQRVSETHEAWQHSLE